MKAQKNVNEINGWLESLSHDLIWIDVPDSFWVMSRFESKFCVLAMSWFESQYSGSFLSSESIWAEFWKSILSRELIWIIFCEAIVSHELSRIKTF